MSALDLGFLTAQHTEPLLSTKSKLAPHEVFKVSKEDLMELFNYDDSQKYDKRFFPNQKVSRSLVRFREIGGPNTLTRKLFSDKEQGINGDRFDILRRINKYGTNKRQLPQTKGFFSFLKDGFSDATVQVLIFFATLAVLTGAY